MDAAVAFEVEKLEPLQHISASQVDIPLVKRKESKHIFNKNSHLRSKVKCM